MRCRKNQASLTAQEKARFVAAVLALKANGTYNQYVALHVNNMPSAHRAPAFFAWHREMLRRFELDLQAIDSSVTLPYWNWTIDNAATSSIWNSDFMGGNGRPSDGKVMDGAFAFDGGNWPLSGGGFLARRFGLGIATLPTAMDLSTALGTTPYDLSPYNDGASLAGFRNTLEGWRNGPQLHNRVHVWVGGSMSPSSSPDDPVFFLHHCFIDKCWADWQALHPMEPPYGPVSGAPSGHNLNDVMQPWAVTPASLVDHHALGYAYDTENVCRSTFKFIDDGGGIKQLVDTHITHKLVDDRPTIKLFDDRGTLKVLDDGGGTFKSVDDVKLPAFDVGNLGKPAEDQINPIGLAGDPLGGAPFVLATPHHSMAWAETFPGAIEGALAQLNMQLASLEGMAAELERRANQGETTEAERSQLEALRREIVGIRDEREALQRHVRK